MNERSSSSYVHVIGAFDGVCLAQSGWRLLVSLLPWTLRSKLRPVSEKLLFTSVLHSFGAFYESLFYLDSSTLK